MSTETLIIGGGAIGSAIACFLSSMAPDSHRITVVERDPTLRIASSSLSASSIRQQFSTPINVQLSQFGYEFMHALGGSGPRSEVGLESRGYLFLARADQAEALSARTSIVRKWGGSVTELDRAALRKVCPWLECSDVTYASQGTQGEGWFDGYMLQQHFARRARARGVTFRQGEVAELKLRGNKVVGAVLCGGEELAADLVVNAAGAWSAPLAREVGVDLPVRARRRTVFVVSCPTALPEFPILVDTTGVFIRPEQKHFLCILSPRADLDGDDLPLDPDFSLFEDHIWPALAARVPAFEALRIERSWAGYYEFNTADHNGLVGQVGPENFYVATGFSGHGLMHSAGVGRGVAELLLHDTYRTLDLSPLSPARLSTGALIVEDAVY